MEKHPRSLKFVENQQIALPTRDAALLREMFKAWTTRRIGGNGQLSTSVSRDLTVLLDMVKFTGRAPWYWTEEDFENWCYEIGATRRLALTTQRHYQGSIRKFFDYLVQNTVFRNKIREISGIDLVQICHAENCIPHILENERVTERRAFSHAEIELFFSRLDESITNAVHFSAKDFRPLQRDKALFYTIYIAGLRVSEARGLNITSFQPNPKFPDFGQFGFISVWGKGSRGSGKKYRQVPITHIGLPPVLDWYCKLVRPGLMTNAEPNEDALFLSERGRRIAISTIESRFQKLIGNAGMDGQGLVPHCLRHSSVTHEALRMSLEGNRMKHGHTYSVTTQNYTHIPDEYINEEITQVISNQLDLITGDDDDNRN